MDLLIRLIGHQTATGFSLRLAARVAAGREANVAISPLSIHVVLGLVAAGARGQTLDQLLSVLGPEGDDLAALASQIVDIVLADGSDAGGPKLSVATGVFLDASLSLKPLFKEIVTGKYKAEAKNVDFQTKATEVTNEVNSWAENATAGLIKDLLPPGSINSDTRLVLSNALYFKGTWSEKFDASETKDSEFHLLNGTSVQVPFLTTREDQFISSYDGFKVLRLPYSQGEDKRQFSMYIFLPETRDGLWSLEERMSSEPDFLSRHVPSSKVDVSKFKLPKFKISFSIEASAVLKDLGLVLPFCQDCDLAEMVNSPIGSKLYVSAVFHKSFVEVNEEGTEAAAATAAAIELSYVPPVNFEADHPFVFLIREELTGVVLFSGHVINPLLTE